jgi:hypothetical protein
MIPGQHSYAKGMILVQKVKTVTIYFFLKHHSCMNANNNYETVNSSRTFEVKVFKTPPNRRSTQGSHGGQYS